MRIIFQYICFKNHIYQVKSHILVANQKENFNYLNSKITRNRFTKINKPYKYIKNNSNLKTL